MYGKQEYLNLYHFASQPSPLSCALSESFRPSNHRDDDRVDTVRISPRRPVMVK